METKLLVAQVLELIIVSAAEVDVSWSASANAEY
jgi:hypothetical protein